MAKIGEKLRSVAARNFEWLFVFAAIIAVSLIGYLATNKLALLNVFYLPVMLIGFTHGRRKGVLSASIVIAAVITYAAFQFHEFSGGLIVETIISMAVWSAFLIASGFLAGWQYERGELEKAKATELNIEMKKMYEGGEKALSEKRQLRKDVLDRDKTIRVLNTAIKALREKMFRNLVSTMDPRVAHMMFEKQLKEERWEISVLCAVPSDFEEWAGKEKPEQVTQVLNKYLSEMELILSDFNGHIENHNGGVITCEFGAPVEYKTHALLAAAAAITMQKHHNRLGFPWKLQIGVSTGSAVVALVGEKKKTYTTLGWPARNAADLSQACRPGSILVDVDCYGETNRHIEAKPAWRYDIAQQEEVREQIEKLRHRITEDPNDSGALYELGTLYMRKMYQPEQALRFFERALQIEPANTDAKLAYAEANMQTRTFTIETGGGQAPVAVYEVVGVRDPLTDQERLPVRFLEKYAGAAKLVDLPDQLILPVEALDGTVGHSRVVGVLSYAIADALGLNEAQKKNVLIAGYVQDIGKKLVPHEILTRADMLSEKEYAEIRRHTSEATPVLKMAGFDRAVIEIVENHHERHNGEGYPDGKSGQQIPMGARITAAADAYDAMVAWRPFRGPKSRTEALEELRRETRAGLYDAAVVDALTRLVKDD